MSEDKKARVWYVDTGSIEDEAFKMNCGNVFEFDPERDDWDVVKVIEHSAYLAVKQELDAARAMLDRWEDEHIADIKKQLADVREELENAKAQIADYEVAIKKCMDAQLVRDTGMLASNPAKNASAYWIQNVLRETLKKWGAK